MNLLKITLEPGRHYPSVAVKTQEGWTGQTLTYQPFWKNLGYDGVHVCCPDPENRAIFKADNATSTILLGRESGFVCFENVEIEAGFSGDERGKGRAVFAGYDAINRDELLPFSVTFKNCVLRAPHQTTWGVHSYGCDLHFEDSLLDFKLANEHAVYMHGFYREGFSFVRSHVQASGAEGLKFTGRPRTEFYPDGWDYSRSPHHQMDGMHPPVDGTENATIRVLHSTIEDWHQAWTWRGGGGIVVQGAGANVHVKGTKIIARSDHHLGRCLMIDDSGWEHFSPEGVGGEPPANGHVLIEDSMMVAAGPTPSPWRNPQPIVRVAHINSSGSTGAVARSFQMLRCGIYGPETHVEIKNMAASNLAIEECNTAEVGARCAELLPGDERLRSVARLSMTGSGYDAIGQPAIR